MCKHIDSLPEVIPDEFYVETIDEEIRELIEFTADRSKKEFKLATNTPVDDYHYIYNRNQLQFFTTFLENCPAGRERMLTQQLYSAKADTLLKMKEWITVKEFAATQVIDSALKNEDEQLSINILRRLNKSEVGKEWEMLKSLIGDDDIELLLISALSISKPQVMTRYQIEAYDGSQISAWAENEDNIERDWIKDLALEDEAATLCEKTAEIDLENPETDFSPDEFSPDENSIQLLKAMYSNDIADYHCRNLIGALVMQDALRTCEPFKNIMTLQMRKAAISALNLKPEEEKIFANLSQGLCGCLEESDREAGMKCYTELLGTFGLTEENTSMSNISDENMRIMKMVMAIGQAKEAFCGSTNE